MFAKRELRFDAVLVRATCRIFKWIYLVDDVSMSAQINV